MAAGKFSNLDFSPPAREFAPLPDQENSPAPEYFRIPEEYDSVSSAPVKTEKKLSSHEMLKKMFLAPVLGIITVLTVASSAFGTDLISSYFGDILGALGIGFPILPNRSLFRQRPSFDVQMLVHKAGNHLQYYWLAAMFDETAITAV